MKTGDAFVYHEGVGNGNKSQVHWDMVCIQRPEYGGGEVWFDGKLIRKDGKFVLPSLWKLNPEYLLKGPKLHNRRAGDRRPVQEE